MDKTLLLFLLVGLFSASCSGAPAPVPTGTPVPASTPTPVLFEPQLIKEVQLETQTGTSYTLDWSQDGEILAAGSGYEITLLSKDLSDVAVLRPEDGALGMSWSPDGNQLATIFGYRHPEIRIWRLDRDSHQLSPVQELDGGSDQYGASWSPDGKLLATLADDDKTTIQMWDTGTWQQIARYELPYEMPRRALNWSTDGNTLYDAGEANGQVVVFAMNVADGNIQEIAKFPSDQVSMLAISPDATMIAVTDERGLLRFVSLNSGNTLAEIQTVEQPVDLAWNPDGKTLAVLAYKTSLQLWQIKE